MSSTAVTIIKGALAFNALLDLALGFTAVGDATKGSFPTLSAEGVSAVNAGFPAHGFIRGFAALNLDSKEARQAAQLSYLGELVMAYILKKDFDTKGGMPMIIIPTAMIGALEYLNRHT
jgi:hypothetical protein